MWSLITDKALLVNQSSVGWDKWLYNIVKSQARKMLIKKNSKCFSSLKNVNFLNLFRLFSMFRFKAFKMDVQSMYSLCKVQAVLVYSLLIRFRLLPEWKIGRRSRARRDLKSLKYNWLPFKRNLPLERSEKATKLLRQKKAVDGDDLTG